MIIQQHCIANILFGIFFPNPRYGKMLMQFANYLHMTQPFFPQHIFSISIYGFRKLSKYTCSTYIHESLLFVFVPLLSPQHTTSDCRALFMRKSFRLQSKRFDCIFYGGGCMFNSKAPCRHLTYIMPVQGLTSQKI